MYYFQDIWHWRILWSRNLGKGSLTLRIYAWQIPYSAEIYRSRAIFLLPILWVYCYSLLHSEPRNSYYISKMLHYGRSPSFQVIEISTSQRWSFSAPLLSSGQLPTSPLSMLPEALCRLHRSSSRLAWPLIPTCGSTVTREMLQRPATSTLVLCATCAVYWLTTSPRQLHAASSLPGWTTAMHCWVAHRRQLSTSYSAPRTTWPESSAREPGLHRRQAAASLATLASGEAAGHL